MSIIKEFFYLPKSDRRAIVAILVAITLVGIAIFALNFVGLESNPIEEDGMRSNVPNSNAPKNIACDTEEATQTEVETFVFDPNTADSTQLLRLGLRPWQVHNIYKYRAKGGVYRTKEDFAFVYGLTVKEYRRLAPYIRISEDFRPASTLAEVRNNNRYNNYDSQHPQTTNTSTLYATNEKSLSYTPKMHKGEHIAINASDTSALKAIPGIGSYFARQTIRYREQLGGFVDKNQLLEIENFPEEALEYIKIDNENVRKLNVNKLTLAQLRRHPYINYYQARAITDYRRLHGSINSIAELKLMKEFTEFDLNRIEPYIEY